MVPIAVLPPRHAVLASVHLEGQWIQRKSKERSKPGRSRSHTGAPPGSNGPAARRPETRRSGRLHRLASRCHRRRVSLVHCYCIWSAAPTPSSSANQLVPGSPPIQPYVATVIRSSYCSVWSTRTPPPHRPPPPYSRPSHGGAVDLVGYVLFPWSPPLTLAVLLLPRSDDAERKEEAAALVCGVRGCVCGGER